MNTLGKQITIDVNISDKTRASDTSTCTDYVSNISRKFKQ